jgi:hypothetical protein
MKKRILLLLTVALVMAAMALVIAVPAFATQPTEPNPPQDPGASRNSDNCVGYFSAQVKHNGSTVRNQDRQTEVRNLQDRCNNANQK